MVLATDELYKVISALVRCQIDLSQSINAFLWGDMKGGNINIAAVLSSLAVIVKDAND